MNKKIIIGSVFAVVILVLASFPSVASTQSEERRISILQRIKDRIANDDCGCNDEILSTTEFMDYPIICGVLWTIIFTGFVIFMPFNAFIEIFDINEDDIIIFNLLRVILFPIDTIYISALYLVIMFDCFPPPPDYH